MPTLLRTNATFTGSLAGQDWLSTMYWQPGTPGGSNTDASDVVARFRAFWNAMAGIICVGVVVNFDTTCLAYLDSTGVLQQAYTASPVATVAGTMTGDTLPLQTQGLIRWNTTAVINGRRVRGRTFVPAPSETHSGASGIPTGAYTSGLAAGVAAMMTAGSTASFPVVWHRPVNNTGGSGNAISGGGFSPTWSVLRTRRS